MLKTFILPVILVTLCAGAVVVGGRPASAATTFSIQSLGTLAQASRAYDISRNGNVTGVSVASPNSTQAVLKQGSQPLQGLGTAGGLSFSEGFGVNSSGTVVGLLTNHGVTSQERGFVYQNGTMTVLPSTSAGARAFDINDAGVIVGQYDFKPSIFTTTTATPLPALPNGGSGSGLANAINSDGDIAGWGIMTGSGSLHPFLYDAATGTMTKIPYVTGRDGGQALDVSDNDVVVGYMTTPTFTSSHAFRYANGVSIDLGTLGGTHSYAYGVNDAGQIVGASTKTVGQFDNSAFLWENGVMIDLNTLLPANSGWTLREAYGINDAGQIVGTGFFNGQPLGYILTPVPEPAAIAGMALLAAALRRRRHHHQP